MLKPPSFHLHAFNVLNMHCPASRGFFPLIRTCILLTGNLRSCIYESTIFAGFIITLFPPGSAAVNGAKNVPGDHLRIFWMPLKEFTFSIRDILDKGAIFISVSLMGRLIAALFKVICMLADRITRFHKSQEQLIINLHV